MSPLVVGTSGCVIQEMTMLSTKKRISFCVIAAAVTSVLGDQRAQAAVGTWIGPTNSNWSNSAAWQDGIIPNAQGDTAQYVAGGSQITLQDVVAGVTVGTLKVTGTANSSWQFTPNNNIIMDQDGAGPLRASIINDIQGTGATSNLAVFMNAPSGANPGWWTLNDDLFISNTSNSTRTTGAIQMRGRIQGNGNIWIENISNNIGIGQVALTAQGNFGGNTTIAKGAVTFTRGDIFSPGPGNFVTIGSTGGGDATLAGVGGGIGNIENNFVAAANSGGTLVFASNPSNNANMNIKSTNTNAAAVRLDGDLSFDNRVSNGSIFVIGDPITGVGKLTKIGVGAMRVTNTNSYAGGTVVNASSLSVGHADAFNNGFGFYDATDGTLGSGDVTVNNTATQLQIESGVAAINVIANSAALYLGAGGISGKAQLDSGVNETVGGLVLGGVTQTAPGTYGSSSSGATFQNDAAFSGPGTVTLALGRVLNYDINGTAAGAGGATPNGNWNGSTVTFNTDSTGGSGGTVTGNSLSTDPVVFTAAGEGTGSFTVNVTGTQSAALVGIARGDVTLAGGTINTGTYDVDASATGTVTSTVAGDGSGNVSKTGGGSLSIPHFIGNTLAVSGGTLKILPIADLTTSAGVSPSVSNVTSVGVTGGAKLNLSNARIVTNDAQGTKTGVTYNGIQGLVQTGRAGGAWNGVGINTDQPLAVANETAIGVATAAEAKGLVGAATTMWSGQVVDANDTLVMYTWAGDANLDGKVNADDYASIDLYSTIPGEGSWNHGDFNYSGTINADDYALIDSNVQNVNYSPFWTTDVARGAATAGLTAVPEPTAGVLLGVAAAGMFSRRRRGAASKVLRQNPAIPAREHVWSRAGMLS
jgi:autotransporter-associated beta strand protein